MKPVSFTSSHRLYISALVATALQCGGGGRVASSLLCLVSFNRQGGANAIGCQDLYQPDYVGTLNTLSWVYRLCIAFGEESNHEFIDELIKVQCVLQDIGSFIATPAVSARAAHSGMK